MIILIVDDNPLNIEICREILDGAFEIATAGDGEEALRLAQKLNPRIVLLDVMLPGLDGYEICRRLRRLPGLSKPFVVLISAKAMPAERAAGLAAGADAYITKPFDDAELLAVVERALQPQGVRGTMPRAS